MKSVVAQNRNIKVIDQPIPTLKDSYVLIKTMHSVISPGTELSMIEASSNRSVSLGYSAAGVVLECGNAVQQLEKGDVVACYGAPYVQHSEYLLVPQTLCAKVPATVEPKEAALAGIGAIAIHALRIADLQFGETVVVAGLGLVGQMIAKIANAAAFNVISFDVEQQRAKMLADTRQIKSFSGLNEMEAKLMEETNLHGADAVLLCTGGKGASLTSQSLRWIRDKGKVVIVGDLQPDFPRELMFSKEAQILISRAGGPGRYDQRYEEQALDYPYGFVRWTEGRNVAEYLRLVAENRIQVQPFLTGEVDFENVAIAYEQLLSKQTTALTKVINFSE